MKLFRLGSFLFFGLFLTAAQARAITVDGLVNDWGVTPGAFGSSSWTPSTGIHVEEDQNPSIDYLNPGYGGQKFDVEALYFNRDNNFAYFAIVSGFPLEGRLNYQGQDYFAGDVAFDFGSDGSYEFGLETTGAGQGNLYGNASWQDPLFTICGPYNLAGGTLLGASAFAYDNTTYLSSGHYVFEFSIPFSYFGAYWSNPMETPEFSFQWTMSCGNDCLKLDVPFGTIPMSPEPATCAMLLFGAAGLLLTKKNRCK